MMPEKLKLALLQTTLYWEDPKANRLHIQEQIQNLTTPSDIIVLPEMFSSGFTMNPKNVAESMEGETVQWMMSIAKEKNTAICGSLVIEESQAYYNRFLFVTPSGEIFSYDKRHTFTLAGEHKVYKRGTEQHYIDYLGWKICPLVCYDLRFPVWARNTVDYDVLIYVANWPKPRVHAWDTLLKARAIENMCFCVGVNRIGIDENGHEYLGHSAVYDVLGNTLAFSDKSEFLTVEIDKKEIGTLREKFMFLQDRDTFNLK